MKVDLEKYRKYIETRIAEGASLRMLENEIGIERQKLSREMKKAGMRVPTRIESVKFLWKNHAISHVLIGSEPRYFLDCCLSYCRQCDVQCPKMSAFFRISVQLQAYVPAQTRVYLLSGCLVDIQEYTRLSVSFFLRTSDNFYLQPLLLSAFVWFHLTSCVRTSGTSYRFSQCADVYNGLKKCNKRRNTSA